MKDMVQSKEIKKNTSIHILDILNFLGERFTHDSLAKRKYFQLLYTWKPDWIAK